MYLRGLPTGLSISLHADSDRDDGVGATAEDDVSLCYGLGWEWKQGLINHSGTTYLKRGPFSYTRSQDFLGGRTFLPPPPKVDGLFSRRRYV